MKIIPENVVEETWKEVATLSLDKAKKEMLCFGKKQKRLLEFIMLTSSEMEIEAQELLLYMLLVIYRMFVKNCAFEFKRITHNEIIKQYEINIKFLEKLEKSHELFINKMIKSQLLTQPFVMKYIADTIIEAPESKDDPIFLSQKDAGMIYILLKTVVDLFDSRNNSANDAPDSKQP